MSVGLKGRIMILLAFLLCISFGSRISKSLERPVHSFSGLKHSGRNLIQEKQKAITITAWVFISSKSIGFRLGRIKGPCKRIPRFPGHPSPYVSNTYGHCSDAI